MRSLAWLAATVALAPVASLSQTAPPSNAIGECTLILDPTALRLCLESSKQARPAAVFDPTAQQGRFATPNGTDLLPSWPGASPSTAAGSSPPDNRAGRGDKPTGGRIP